MTKFLVKTKISTLLVSNLCSIQVDLFSREEFPVAKLVASEKILDLVSLAQKPIQSNIGTSREALAVFSVLPSIQAAAIRLLESLVLCLGRNLVPQGGLVSYLCSQVIVWTHQQQPDWPYAMNKPYRLTRLAAYCCLYSWLSVSRADSQLETILDKLIPTMLSDIHAHKQSVKLRLGSKTKKNKKKQQMLENIEERSEKVRDETANHELCERALKVLALLLQSAFANVKVETYQRVTETVLRLVRDVPVPYSDVNCLSALYQLLLTLCLEPHPLAAPPLAPALATFTAHLHHPDSQVKTVCFTAIACLDKIIHPSAATLYFPLSKEKENLNMTEWNKNSNAEPETKKRKIKKYQSDYKMVDEVIDSCNETEHLELCRNVIDQDSDASVEVISECLLKDKSSVVENKQDIVSLEEDDVSDISCNVDQTNHTKTVHKDKTESVADICEEIQTKIDSNNVTITNDHVNYSKNEEIDEDFKAIEDVQTKLHSNSFTNNQPESSNSLTTEVSDMLMDFKDEVDVVGMG